MPLSLLKNGLPLVLKSTRPYVMVYQAVNGGAGQLERHQLFGSDRLDSLITFYGVPLASFFCLQKTPGPLKKKISALLHFYFLK
jgi:hypothetical protein